MKLPPAIRDRIDRHHEGGVTERDCIVCASGCCSQGGFAILENVLAIYESYRRNELERMGYRFPPGLSLPQFIFLHFDVCGREVGPEGDRRPLLTFHMKSIDERGRPITIPSQGDYWTVRRELFQANPWLNRGCVFLSRPVPNWPRDDGVKERRCILHRPDSMEAVGPKPVDCLYYTCVRPFEAKTPTDAETAAWFHALAVAFPGSRERFERILAGGPPPPPARTGA